MKKTEIKFAPAKSNVSNGVVFLVFVVCFMAIGAMFWFWLGRESLRLDEAQSLWQTSHTVHETLKIVAQDVHVPLYHILLHVWQTFFGNSVLVGRLFSLLFFLLTLPAVYVLGRSVDGRGLGIFSVLLITFSPFLNWFGSEIRMYSLFTFFTVLNQIFFIRIYRGYRGAWFWFVLTGLLGIYTHYFFFLVFLGQFAFYLWARKKFPKKTFRNLFFAGSVFFLSILPWAYYVYHLGSFNNTRPMLPSPTSIDLFNSLSQFVYGFQGDRLNTLIVSLWPIGVLFLFLNLQNRRRLPDLVTYFVMAVVVPISVVFAVSIFLQPIYLSRYFIAFVPSLYILFGLLLSAYPRILSWTLRSLLILTMAFTLGREGVSASTPVKEDYQAAAEYLNQKTSYDDVVLLSAPFTVYPVEYYYHGPSVIRTIPDWNRFQEGAIPQFTPQGLDSQVSELKKVHLRAWVLLSYNQGYEKQIKDYFDQNFALISERDFPTGIKLYEYQLRYDVPTYIVRKNGL